jgi:hypothetical protein
VEGIAAVNRDALPTDADPQTLRDGGSIEGERGGGLGGEEAEGTIWKVQSERE